MTMTTKEMRIQHYSSFQKILLVGEGDFSFSACLARAFGSAVNMVATSLDSEETLLTKHWTCEENLDDLEERGCLVLHEVDVHDMNKHPNLIGMKFDVIIFNFPHAGHFSSLCERDAILIKKHKRLLRAFFRSASGMVKEDGEVHVTHRDDYPYNKWEVEKQAQKAGLVLKEKVPFVKQNYPGYHNKRGSFIDGNKRFPIEDPFTFKFSLDRHRTTCHTSNAVSGYDHSNLRDSVIQSIKNKVFALEVEHFLSTASLDHQETTPTSINSTDESFTLKDAYTATFSLDPQETTSTSINSTDKSFTLKDTSPPKPFFPYQETTSTSINSDKSFTLKDSKFSLDHHQETTLRRTSNENVPLKGPLPPKPFSPYQETISTSISSDKSFTPKDSRRSLDHQETTLRRISNENVPLKGPSPPKPLSPYQETTSRSPIVSRRVHAQMPIGHGSVEHHNYHEDANNIVVRDYVDDMVREILDFFRLCARRVFRLLVKLAIATFYTLFIFFIFLILLSLLF